MRKKLKHHFLDAVISGSLGTHTDKGVIVTSKEFVEYFGNENINKNKKDYLRSYLPSVAIEAGRNLMQHNKYLFKISHGIFRIHPDAIERHKLKHKSWRID